MTEMDWRHSSACRDEDPELFFPAAQPGTAPYAAQVAEAKAVCSWCPVRAECLAYALDELTDGVAGGLDVDERRALRGDPIPELSPAPAPAPVPTLAEQLLAEDVDRVMVERLAEQGAGTAGTRSATRAEVAAAAVLLVTGPRGLTLNAAARRLGVSGSLVGTWVTTARAQRATTGRAA